jgi:S1-C subfamily serine protease
MNLRLLLIAALLAFCSANASAAEKAWYGFHIDPKTEGFPLNPVVRSVVIDKIKTGSPADAQKMRVGDEIIEAEGRVVPGTRALQLIALLNKKPGERLRLRLRRPNGEVYSVLLVGIRKPGT